MLVSASADTLLLLSAVLTCKVPKSLAVPIPNVSNKPASLVTVPSKYASLNSNEDVPKSISLSEDGAKTPSVYLIWSALATLKSIWSSVSAVMLVSASASKINSSPFISRFIGAPTAPDISVINIEAPLAGAVVNVICVPPVAIV